MKKYLSNERGLSLVEVVASLIIISIILTSFFGLFVQSKKAGVSSENTIDATYLAQQTMEEMYGYTQRFNSLETMSDAVRNNTDYFVSCTPDTGEISECKFSKTEPDITITAKYPDTNGINKNLVYVRTDIKRENEHADPVIMETIWLWLK